MMATERLGPPGGDDPPDHPTRRLPRLQRRCLACDGEMAPLAHWTGGPDGGWGDLRFGPHHPSTVPMPMVAMPPQAPRWEMGGRLSLPPEPPLRGSLDMAPEVVVQTFACTDCGRLDWYVMGPRPGHEGGLE
jgi:hypothetical protein